MLENYLFDLSVTELHRQILVFICHVVLNTLPQFHRTLNACVVLSQTRSKGSDCKDYCRTPFKTTPFKSHPCHFFRESYVHLVPILSSITNQWLESGSMPSQLTETTVFPILKNPRLGTDDLNIYWPISNCPICLKYHWKGCCLPISIQDEK